MSRKITEILKDMDQLEKIEITDELVDTLREEFEDEIESEDKNEIEKVAKGAMENMINQAKESRDYGKSDRV